jgi:predicted small secreted protein
MKHFVVIAAFALALTGCGTMGGAVSGAGTDLQKAGEWIKSR